MPSNKDFKRVVRRRMQKTGESYTAARAQLLQHRPDPKPADFAALAGMSDATVEARTGCAWDKWVWALDSAGAHQWPHREIAAYVRRTHKIPGWWAQTVTVGYERIKGLRAIGQRRDGGFEASKSKTLPVKLATLYRAARDRRVRARWLPDVDLTIRKASRNKSIRVTWPDGTPVELSFLSKGPAKSQITVQHSRLADRAAATRVKAFWGERLEVLAGNLGAPCRTR